MGQPSSVVHYTSLEVLSILLNKALSSDDGYITFHLSHLSMMNDSREGQFILSRFYTDSIIKRKLKEDWDLKYYPYHIPFILSLIATNRFTKNRGSLPMWKMYGNDFRGALIRFDYKKLCEFCKNHSLIFNACKYRTVAEANTLIADFNKRKVTFGELMRESCLTKQIFWKYENEWRIIAYSPKDNIKIKDTNRGLVEYIELNVPINLIEEICIGPLASEESLQSLRLIKENLRTVYHEQVHFKIRQSKLSYK